MVRVFPTLSVMFRICNIPMNVGLRWAPQWTFSPIRNPFLKGKKIWSPFYGIEPLSEACLPTPVKVFGLHVSFPAMKEWALFSILPLFVYFWPSRVIYPTRRGVRCWSNIVSVVNILKSWGPEFEVASDDTGMWDLFLWWHRRGWIRIGQGKSFNWNKSNW